MRQGVHSGNRRKKVLALLSAILAALATGALASCTPKGDQDIATNDLPPLSEYSSLVASCLKERGWDAEATSDNSVVAAPVDAGLPEGQLEPYQADLSSCERELGYDVAREPSQEQLVATHTATVEARACMLQQGYETPQVPSEGAFIDSYLEGEPWQITEFLPELSPDDAEGLFAICPPPEYFPVY